MADQTKEQWDEAGRNAEAELREELASASKSERATMQRMFDFHLRYVFGDGLVAGHKRLGRLYVKLSREGVDDGP